MVKLQKVIDFKCRLCHEAGQDSELMIGMTSNGLQMTCKKHDAYVGVLDLREYIHTMVQCMRSDEEIPDVMLDTPRGEPN